MSEPSGAPGEAPSESQSEAQTQRAGGSLSTHDYGHLTVEDGAGGEEAEAGPAETTGSRRDVRPSGSSAALSTHDYGHLTVEDEP